MTRLGFPAREIIGVVLSHHVPATGPAGAASWARRPEVTVADWPYYIDDPVVDRSAHRLDMHVDEVASARVGYTAMFGTCSCSEWVTPTWDSNGVLEVYDTHMGQVLQWDAGGGTSPGRPRYLGPAGTGRRPGCKQLRDRRAAIRSARQMRGAPRPPGWWAVPRCTPWQDLPPRGSGRRA